MQHFPYMYGYYSSSYCSSFDTPFKNKIYIINFLISHHCMGRWYLQQHAFILKSNEAFKPYQQTFISMQFITVCLSVCRECLLFLLLLQPNYCCLWYIYLICLRIQTHTSHIKMMNRCFVRNFHIYTRKDICCWTQHALQSFYKDVTLNIY